jgi:hypothetical protein
MEEKKREMGGRGGEMGEGREDGDEQRRMTE